jgi:hypothetical protein
VRPWKVNWVSSGQASALALLMAEAHTMLRPARQTDGNRYFHVIHRTSLPAPMFLRPKDYRDFLQIMREGLERHPLPLLAYTVMNDHWHLVLNATGTSATRTADRMGSNYPCPDGCSGLVQA